MHCFNKSKNVRSALSHSKKYTKHNEIKYFIVSESQPSAFRTIIFISYLLTTAQLGRTLRQYRKQNRVTVGR